MKGYSTSARKWQFLDLYSKQYQLRVEIKPDVDVEFSGLQKDINTVVSSWVPAELLISEPDATEKWWQKDAFLILHKINITDRSTMSTKTDVEFSGLSNNVKVAEIGWVPAALLNAKLDAKKTQCIPYEGIFDISAKMTVSWSVLETVPA